MFKSSKMMASLAMGMMAAIGSGPINPFAKTNQRSRKLSTEEYKASVAKTIEENDKRRLASAATQEAKRLRRCKHNTVKT